MLWRVHAGGRIPLERHDLSGIALIHRLACTLQVFGDAALLVSIPAPREQEPGAGSNEDEKLRHGYNPNRDHSARASTAEIRSSAIPDAKPKSGRPARTATLRFRRSQLVDGATSLKRVSSP